MAKEISSSLASVLHACSDTFDCNDESVVNSRDVGMGGASRVAAEQLHNLWIRWVVVSLETLVLILPEGLETLALEDVEGGNVGRSQADL